MSQASLHNVEPVREKCFSLNKTWLKVKAKRIVHFRIY